MFNSFESKCTLPQAPLCFHKAFALFLQMNGAVFSKQDASYLNNIEDAQLMSNRFLFKKTWGFLLKFPQLSLTDVFFSFS